VIGHGLFIFIEFVIYNNERIVDIINETTFASWGRW